MIGINKIFIEVKELIKRPVIKNSLIYAVTDGICRALSFILLPFISFYLLPEELGVAANFDVLLSIVTLLSGQAIVNGLSYFYYERNRELMARLVSSLILIIILTNLLFSIIIYFACGLIDNYLHIGLGLQLLSIASCFVMMLYNINMILYRLEDKPYSFAKLQLLHAVIQIGLVIILVIHLKMGALGKIYSAVGGYFVLSVVHLYLLHKRSFITLKISKDAIKELLKFGIPLLPHSLSFWLKSGMDKVLLTTYCGLAVNGLYSMAMSFGAIYSMVNNSFMMAYVPYLQKRISNINIENNESEELTIVKMSYKIGLLFVLVFLLIVPACWVLMTYLLSDKYAESFQFVPWMMLSLTIYAFYNLVIQFPYTVKKTLWLGVITFSGSLIQLFLTYILVRYLGADGIKISMVLGALIIMLGVWWYSNKVYPLPWFKVFNKYGK